MRKAINIFMLLVLLVDAFLIGYWFGLHSHKVLVVQGSDEFLYSNSFTQFQSNLSEKKEAVKEKAAEKLEPVLEKRAKAKEAAQQAKTAPAATEGEARTDTQNIEKNDTATKDTARKDTTTDKPTKEDTSTQGDTAGSKSESKTASPKKPEE